MNEFNLLIHIAWGKQGKYILLILIFQMGNCSPEEYDDMPKITGREC